VNTIYDVRVALILVRLQHCRNLTFSVSKTVVVCSQRVSKATGVQGHGGHIHVQFRFLRQRCQKKHMQVEYVPSAVQLADKFMKQLLAAVFQNLVKEIGVIAASERSSLRIFRR
jgi:hypothetical protein